MENLSIFRFETVEYPNLGKLITLINGLEQNTEKKTYWALGKKIEDKLCLLSVGKSREMFTII